MKTINDYAPHRHELIILDALGDPTKGRLQIVGQYSSEFYNAARDALRDKNVFDQTLSTLEAENINTLASCVKGWNEEWFLEPFSHEAVVALLAQPKFKFIKEQLERAVLNKALFFRKADKPSE